MASTIAPTARRKHLTNGVGKIQNAQILTSFFLTWQHIDVQRLIDGNVNAITGTADACKQHHAQSIRHETRNGHTNRDNHRTDRHDDLAACRRSDSGPDTMDVTISTTMEITDMVEIVAAESFTLNPQYFCRIYS